MNNERNGVIAVRMQHMTELGCRVTETETDARHEIVLETPRCKVYSIHDGKNRSWLMDAVSSTPYATVLS